MIGVKIKIPVSNFSFRRRILAVSPAFDLTRFCPAADFILLFDVVAEVDKTV